jgi:uncharacterized membrane protein
MESKAKFLGHPVHPMLIVFPLGLLATSLIFDLVAWFRNAPSFFLVSFWMIAAGIMGGLISAIFGLVDWLAIPAGTRAKAIGAWHGIGNAIVLFLFAASWFMRRGTPDYSSKAAVGLSLVAVVIALVTAWLGGELVDRLGVGVDDGAHLNASNSLSHRPARENSREGQTSVSRQEPLHGR